MGDTERPVPDRPEDQAEQAQHLIATGNGPTVQDEEQLLAELYGAPDMAGFYTWPGAVLDGEHQAPAAETGPAVDDAMDGGTSA
ncbi:MULTISPECIES: hypothetical protein [unclassified Streptomyces]|uniref:hypothetical protein n=1 Tax=unclassified Streptomyces TaxID=2593676 RepID=UPI00380B8E13